MADIDCHSEMAGFHRDNVTLSNKQQGEMRTRRDAGRTRLENGLNEAKKPQPKEVRSQGSYQMRTMVQDDDNEYDIDDGAYFASDDLKDDASVALTPLAARRRVCDALVWDGRLKQEATVKRNCVRQIYAAGYHIDIPVYRIVSAKDENDEPPAIPSTRIANSANGKPRRSARYRRTPRYTSPIPSPNKLARTTLDSKPSA